jgi:ABC-type transport system involved in cytochrome c biogenesis permease subunit
MFSLAMLAMMNNNKRINDTTHLFSVIGILFLIAFVAILWISLGRPPLKTLGETRLWYALFLSIIGYVSYVKWKYKWFLVYCFGMTFLFLLLNYLKPEMHNKALMPALQSIWFVPHVIVYIIAYAFLAGAAIVAIKGLILLKYRNKLENKIIELADNLVYLGYAFITLGLIFGALWAKEAWGNYWTWDPKETWAFITWLGYLVYIHYRHSHPNKIIGPLWILAFSFVILLICWFGINYLPSAQSSVHVYSGQ